MGRRGAVSAALAAAAVGGALLAGAAALAQSIWRTQPAHDGRLSVEFPNTPQYSVNELKTDLGTPYRVHTWAAEVDQAAFVLQYLTYPRDVDTADPQASLRRHLDTSARTLDGGRWENVTWLTHQDRPAFDATGTADNVEMRSFAIARGAELVTLVYAGPIGSARSENAARFLGSLRLGQPQD